MPILLRFRSLALNKFSENGALLLFYHGEAAGFWCQTKKKKGSKERWIVVKSLSFESDGHGFYFQIFYLAVWSWISYVTSLQLSLLRCKRKSDYYEESANAHKMLVTDTSKDKCVLAMTIFSSESFINSQFNILRPDRTKSWYQSDPEASTKRQPSFHCLVLTSS